MDFQQLLQQGETNAWLFVPTAILLGALHGLEPGHSKTMMAAFIIAVRGTIVQAVLLGLSAAISHSLIIWALAAAALRYGNKWSAESTEPYFQIISGIMIAALAAWMFWRLRRDAKYEEAHRREHEQQGPHDGRLIDTGHGLIELSVFEADVPPRFRIHFFKNDRTIHEPDPNSTITVTTRRDDHTEHVFTFLRRDEPSHVSYLESHAEIPEPHEFTAIISLSHGNHTHTYEVPFREEHDHHHGHEHHHDHSHGHHHDHTGEGHDGARTQAQPDLSNLTGEDFADAHERAHAEDIARRFTNRTVTTWQIVWFGVTGGLMPCPAAFTILLVCLQLKRFTLGFTLVGCFSFGLAITMVASGVLAAWGLRHAQKRFRNFGKFARRAPYASVALLSTLACFFIVQGWRHLAH